MLIPATINALASAAQSNLAAGAPTHGNSNVELVLGIVMFTLAGFGIVFAGLMAGKVGRPQMPNPEKLTAYECGEPAIGNSWVQFDLRFYTVALIFIVFDVEIALLWPWAAVYKELGGAAFWPFLVFFVLIAVPFIYEWHAGYLNWVRSHAAHDDAPEVGVTTTNPAAA